MAETPETGMVRRERHRRFDERERECHDHAEHRDARIRDVES